LNDDGQPEGDEQGRQDVVAEQALQHQPLKMNPRANIAAITKTVAIASGTPSAVVAVRTR